MFPRKLIRHFARSFLINPDLTPDEWHSGARSLYLRRKALQAAGFEEDYGERQSHKGLLHVLLQLEKKAERKIRSYIT